MFLVRYLQALSIGLLVAASCPSAAAGDSAPARFALVIGNNRAAGLGTLQFADDDAVAQHHLLLEAGVHSRLLVSLDAKTREFHPDIAPAAAPTKRALQQELAAVRSALQSAAARGRRTELIFFFSGHGDVVGGEGQLMLEDGAFSRSDLHALLLSSGADRKLVIVDACSSYHMVVAGKGAAAPRRQPVDVSLFPRLVPADLTDTGFILSNSSDRESHEWARFESGILSYEVRSGLRGGADVNLDGRITYAELAAFIARANESIEHRRLRPDPWLAPPGTGDAAWNVPVLEWSTATAAARVQLESSGHFFVENARGERLLDAHPAPDQALQLFLPAERPLFVRDNDERHEYQIVDRSRANIWRLSVSDEWPARKGARALALRQLFALPFGIGYLHAHRQLLTARGEYDKLMAEPEREAGPWQRTFGYVALGASAAALTFGGLALAHSLGDGSQVSVDRQNEQVKTERALAVGLGALAAAAGGIWAVLRWGPGQSDGVSLGVVPARAARGGSVGATLGAARLVVEGSFQ